LGAFDPGLGQVVEYHLYGGLSLEAIADILGLPLRTVRKRWNRARALLLDVLECRPGGSARRADPVY